MQLFRDGIELSLSTLGEELVVDPGKHEFVLQAAGYLSEQRRLELVVGEKREIVFELKPDPNALLEPPVTPPAVAPSAPVPAAPAVTAPVIQPELEQKPEYWNAQRVAGAAIAGVGTVALGVSAIFGIQTLSKVNEADPYCSYTVCNPRGQGLLDDARTAQTTGLILLGAGVTALVAGGLLFFTADSKLKHSGQSARIEPQRLRIVW
jgi:hypothetical protein